MDAETGKLVVLAIAGVGALAWLSGFVFMLRVTRERQAKAQEAIQRFEVEEPTAAGTIVGEADVMGQPGELSEKLASLLARDGMGVLGPVKIVSCDSRELTFEAAGLMPGSTGYPTAGFRRGRFRLTPSGSTTRIEYAVEAQSGHVFIVLGWAFVILGLVALVGVCAIMFAYVLPSPNPGTRGQAVQTVQVVHFLWPPFLFGSRSLQPGRFIRARVEALVHNLPYT
jgi:hypothetical protein